MRISDWSSDVCSSDLPYRAAGKRRTGTVTRALDIGAIRAQVRALDYVRGTPAEVAMWREGDAEARANLAIEGMDLDADEHALFDMLRAEAVPPPLATAIVLKLLDHPDADQIGRAPVCTPVTNAHP